MCLTSGSSSIRVYKLEYATLFSWKSSDGPAIPYLLTSGTWSGTVYKVSITIPSWNSKANTSTNTHTHTPEISQNPGGGHQIILCINQEMQMARLKKYDIIDLCVIPGTSSDRSSSHILEPCLAADVWIGFFLASCMWVVRVIKYNLMYVVPPGIQVARSIKYNRLHALTCGNSNGPAYKV